MKTSYFRWELVLVAVCLFGLGHGCTGRSEDHLIPQGYIGPVLILYNDPSGLPANLQHGKITYTIPPDGILRIRDPSPEETSWRRVRFFYVNREGQRDELKVPVTGAEFGVFGETDGMRAVDVDGKIVAVTYKAYVVGAPNNRRWETIEASIERAMSGRTQK